MSQRPTSRPIRVMRIIARLNIGGPAVHVILLSERLGPPAFESRLVCGLIGPQEGDMAYLAEQHSVQPVYVAELGRELSPLRDLRTLYKLWRLMRQFKPDVVHTHTAKAGFVGRLAAWLARVPVRVHTFHGHVFRGYFGPQKTQMFLRLERLAGRITDKLITISPMLKDELVNEFHIAPAGKFTIVPLGLDLAPFEAAPRHAGTFRVTFGIPADAPLVGIVGRLVPIKNHALFLLMAAQIHTSQPDVRFAIVGDGELRADLEARVEALGLRDVVIFTGWQHDLRAAYSDMDALVISSLNEGTPVSVIEALAAGVPVVATAVGGIPDLLRHGQYGRLVPVDDPAALADAVCAALVDTDAYDAVQSAILAQYGIERLADDLAALYRDLLAAKHGGLDR
ncbi:glycosyltransferase family 4 protein [Aggregatilinea lenta]|uniref:glycosyltransferase family 4 protein n=1 Tax=Aggregatilinea lenta TaxID=913108 RepID=UPI0013C32FD4|nr:glycosyltransferase family 4 protein [Aggregatilinea lenta]